MARQSERNRVLAESHGDLSTQLAEVAGSRRQFQLVTDSLPVRILRLDPQQVIRFVNIPAAHDQQREPREMVGRPLSEFYAPDTVAAMQPHIRRALDGDHHESDWVARPKAPDDVEKIFSDEWIPERDETGSISGLFWLSTDVTDQRRRIREERQSNQLESLGQLTGGIAHDFNNLLLVVGGNLELLGDDVADRPELLDFLSRAQAAVERGARLTRQLLAFASNQVLAPDWVDVNDMLREFQELLSRTLGDNVAVGLDLADELPKVRVDRAQLESAIINLALNARDAMPDGGRLTLTTELQQTQVATGPGEPQEEYVVVEATDTGVGMTPEVMERVFEPFYTTKDVGKGTGLGLSMVYGFVRQSNGTVTVRSEPGVGTSFRILLPTVGSASPAPELASPVSANPGAAATAEDAAGPPAADGEALPRGSETVLAVDDSDDVRKIAVHILSGLGYRVLEASTAADALHVLSENRGGIDLVFSDVMMPGGMLGTDLARHARSLYPSLRVVLTSASEDAAPTGAEDFVFIIKPYRRSDLARTVRKILDRPA